MRWYSKVMADAKQADISTFIYNGYIATLFQFVLDLSIKTVPALYSSFQSTFITLSATRPSLSLSHTHSLSLSSSFTQPPRL